MIKRAFKILICKYVSVHDFFRVIKKILNKWIKIWGNHFSGLQRSNNFVYWCLIK